MIPPTPYLFEWIVDPSSVLPAAYDRYVKGTYAFILATAEQIAADLPEYLKSQAPWNDRTGKARASLNAFVQADENVISVILGYLDEDVSYATYLETVTFSRAGLLSIVDPSVDIWGMEFERTLRDYFGT